ncbi:MAG TPA: NAD(P)H-dependent oxidoreductase [Solirubrobacteraceae bacterium]|nr:NAD(P)H-dependent oxidoreductase [Solirubrobacteraceae bacterium]
MRILGISGSLRAASYNTALLEAAAELAPEGVSIDIYDDLERLPPYNEDRDTATPPAEVQRLRHAIEQADAVLMATPEYNGAMPGQIKHAVDWASRPHGPQAALWGKPAAAIGASVTDYGAMWAQDQLRRSLGIAGARVLEAELAVGGAPALFDEGRLVDAQTRERLSELVRGLAEHARRFAAAAAA